MFNYGEMMWMKHPEYGETLYMVINPPIECETCHQIVSDWDKDEDGELECPLCGNPITQFNKVICKCGEYDLVSITIAANNNFCCNTDGETIPYNHMVNRIFTFCRKSLICDIEKGKIRLLSKQEANYRKRLLVWTNQETYEPGASMPQGIIEQFPDEN